MIKKVDRFVFSFVMSASDFFLLMLQSLSEFDVDPY